MYHYITSLTLSINISNNNTSLPARDFQASSPFLIIYTEISREVFAETKNIPTFARP
jgi:hypothetical protein